MDSQCCVKVLDRYNSYPCTKKATVERSGKSYCSIHDPEKVAARKKAQDDKYEAQRKERNARYERQAAVYDLCNDVETYVLRALGRNWLSDYLTGNGGK